MQSYAQRCQIFRVAPALVAFRVAALFGAFLIPVNDAAAWQVRLRNDLKPGALATYDLRVNSVRTVRTLRYEEKVHYTQTGRITHLVAQSVDRNRSQRVWMVILDEPQLTQVTRDDQPLAELPDPREIGLPPRGAQLRVTDVTHQHAPAFPVGGSAVQRAAMLLALDFARWPDDLVKPGDSWESPTERDEINGTWTHQYTGPKGRGAGRLATGEFQFDGELSGPLRSAAKIERAEGRWSWRVSKRSLESASADVELSYGDTLPPRRLAVHASLEIKERRHLNKSELDTATQQVNFLSDLSQRLSDPTDATARGEMQRYIEKNPNSLWLQVARDVLNRANYDETTFTELNQSEVKAVMMQLVARWQKAALARNSEPLQPIRATFRQLANANREALHVLARSDDRNVQAVSAFAIAFGEDPSDLKLVTTLCGHDEARIRAWALYGLYERDDDATDPDVVIEAMGDADPLVRYRACMAARRCIPNDGRPRDKAMRKLLNIVNRDADERVREQAAIAIDRIATRADLEELVESEKKQDVPPARRVLEATIKRLKAQPTGSN